MKIIALLILTLLNLPSCTKIGTGPEPAKIRTSIITTRYASKHLPNNAIFQWASGQNTFYNDDRLTNAELDKLIQSSIILELRNKGYVFKPEADSSATHFLIGYVAGLTSSLADSKIEKDYGLYPGLPNNERNNSEKEKGTIIVNIYNPNNDQVIWRGVGQAFATLKDIPQQEREHRLQNFMREMFADFP